MVIFFNLLLIISIIYFIYNLLSLLRKKKKSKIQNKNIILLTLSGMLIIGLLSINFLLFNKNIKNKKVNSKDVSNNYSSLQNSKNKAINNRSSKSNTNNLVAKKSLRQNYKKDNVKTPIDEQWYKKYKLFTSKDKTHTFSLGWIDNSCLQIIFDSKFVLSETSSLKGKVVGNKIIYNGKDANVQVNYYYNDNKIEVIDKSKNAVNYSGFYYYK